MSLDRRKWKENPPNEAGSVLEDDTGMCFHFAPGNLNSTVQNDPAPLCLYHCLTLLLFRSH